MVNFNDWSIRSKLIFPLLAVVVLGGGGIVSVFVSIHNDIINDALPEERALDGIRRTSLELLSEYREFMIAPSDSAGQEISELKKDIEVYEAAFAKSALLEVSDARFVDIIDDAKQKLTRRGDKAISVRLRQLHQIKMMEAFETNPNNSPASAVIDADAIDGAVAAASIDLKQNVEVSSLDGLVSEYLAELREYVLAPSDATLREIAAIEHTLERTSSGLVGQPASKLGEQAGDDGKRMRIGRLLAAGRGTTALTNEFLTDLDALEMIEDELLDVLAEAGSVIARRTDNTFVRGFVTVAAAIFSVLAMIFLIGYLVSRRIGRHLTGLSNAAGLFGQGDLSVRADVTGKDEIGGLAVAFNQMAESLEASILQREHAEAAAEKTEALIKALISNLPAETFVQDAEGRYILVNPTWRKRMGLTEAEVLGKTNQEVLHGKHAEVYIRQDRTVWETGKILDEEVQIPFDDQLRTMHTINFPLVDGGGNIVGVGGIASDVTDFRRAEMELRQAQKMEAVGQLTGGVAHDFNNLLASIMGNAELLEDELGSDDRSLQAIIRAATHGAQLTQRLLAYSRLQPLSPRPIDIGQLAADMSDLLVRTLGETIEVMTKTDTDLWSALADPGQVENALLNLALNARDAMPGGGKLTIECANVHVDEFFETENLEVTAGDYVMLAVSDNGTGMTAAVQAHAFDPFFTTKDVGQGSGLGLSMVYGFGKQTGGHVNICSEEGQGTTVKLYLPRAEKNSKSGQAPAGVEIAMGRDEFILVIEDNPDVANLAANMLERLGYRAKAVCDAASAMNILRDGEHVDLVLSDVILPGGTSGPDLAVEIRATYPDLAIIFMSGYSTEAAKRDNNLGPDTILLNKPFQRQLLATTVRAALDRRGAK